MKAFGRKADENKKPVEMTYDGRNGMEILEWSRDENTSASFQWRDGVEPNDVRVFLTAPHLHWAVVPVGSTIRLQPSGDLELVLPEPEATEPPQKED